MGFFFGSVLEYILKAIGCSIKNDHELRAFFWFGRVA
jgi:hypothetical protein